MKQCDDCPGRTHPRCCWNYDDRTPNNSEVARLMRSIGEEYSAGIAALNGPACVARHQTITAHTENMAKHCTALRSLVGDEQGMEMAMVAMEATPTKDS